MRFLKNINVLFAINGPFSLWTNYVHRAQSRNRECSAQNPLIIVFLESVRKIWKMSLYFDQNLICFWKQDFDSQGPLFWANVSHLSEKFDCITPSPPMILKYKKSSKKVLNCWNTKVYKKKRTNLINILKFLVLEVIKTLFFFFKQFFYFIN